MTTTAHRIPLEALQQRAIEELANNPTITTYVMVDGTAYLANLHNEIQRRIDYALDRLCDLIGIDWKAITEPSPYTIATLPRPWCSRCSCYHFATERHRR